MMGIQDYSKFAARNGLWVPVAGSAVAIPLAAPADTNEHVLATIAVPPIGNNGRCRITALWRNDSNNGNNKTFRVKLNGTGGTSYMAIAVTTALSLQTITIIRNRGAQNSQVGANSGNAGVGTSTSTVATSSIDWSATKNIVLTAQLANGADSVALDDYIVEVMRG